MRDILPGCVENLRTVHRPSDGLFPFSSRLVNGAFVNDYRLPDAQRYTVNTLLGLRAAADASIGGITRQEVDEMVDRFDDRHGPLLARPADLGLHLLLLTGHPGGAAKAQAMVHRIGDTLERTQPSALNMQDLGWIVWGASAATRIGVDGAEAVARSTLDLATTSFVHPRTGLPRHSIRRYRRNIVSFGSLVYFLRAMHEASGALSDPDASALFERGVATAVMLQGPQGEWPWMIQVSSARILDVYPVFSVHQDSMAPLFLLPAIERGLGDAQEAVERCITWGFGANELRTDFYVRSPFFAYRSIERRDRLPRVRRYLRVTGRAVARRSDSFGSAPVRVNEECRSYHLGWILYAWSERVAGSSGSGLSS